jgi:hypothetical protein
MAKMMYPSRWSDGTWRYAIEPKWSDTVQTTTPKPQPPRKHWTARGFFKHQPISRREVAMKASNTRQWLQALLHDGPKPATEVYRLAKLEGIPARSVRRAKRYYGVKSVKTGGSRGGYGARWMWHFPECVS